MKRKTVEIPDGPGGAPRQASDAPMIAFGSSRDDDVRDTSQPIGFDENGNPLYAPHGAHIEVH